MSAQVQAEAGLGTSPAKRKIPPEREKRTVKSPLERDASLLFQVDSKKPPGSGRMQTFAEFTECTPGIAAQQGGDSPRYHKVWKFRKDDQELQLIQEKQ